MSRPTKVRSESRCVRVFGAVFLIHVFTQGMVAASPRNFEDWTPMIPVYGEPQPLGLKSDDYPAGWRHPEISPDGLELFLSYGGAGQSNPANLYHTIRESVTDPFPTPALLENINTVDYYEVQPLISADRLTLYFVTNRYHGWSYLGEPVSAVRSSIDSSFDSVAVESFLNNSSYQECPGFISPDGLRLYYTAGNLSVNRTPWMATRPSVNAAWNAKVALTEIDEPGLNEWKITLTGDERTMIFTRYTSGDAQYVGSFISVRESPDGELTDPIPIEWASPALKGYDQPSLVGDGSLLFLYKNGDCHVAEKIGEIPLNEIGPPPSPTATLSNTPTITPTPIPTPIIIDNPFLDGEVVFYNVERIDVLNSDVVERDPVISDDGLEIIFLRWPSTGSSSVWRATRPSRDVEFGEPSSVPELSPSMPGARHGVFPYDLIDGGKSLLVDSYDNSGAYARNGDPGIRYREDPESSFGPTQYTSLANIQDYQRYENPTGLSQEGLEFFFSKGNASNGITYRIHRSVRSATTDPFDVPILMDQFGSPTEHVWLPRLTSDGRVLIFSLYDRGPLAVAVRPSVDQPFGTIVTYDLGVTAWYFDFTVDLKEFYVSDGNDLYRVRMRRGDPLRVAAHIEPEQPYTTDDLECVLEVENPELHPDISAAYRWFREGEELLEGIEVSGEFFSVTGPILSHNFTEENETYFCTTRVTDGQSWADAQTDPVTIRGLYPTDTPMPPIDTPTPLPPVAEGIGLIAADGFMGLHPAGGATINFSHFSGMPGPIHVIRDANLTGDRRGVFVVDLHGFVSTFSLGQDTLDQIPAENQWYFVPEDIVVAVRPADEDSQSAHILLDNGQILPVGDASNMPDVHPPLPFRDGTDRNPEGDPMNRMLEVPGPLHGPLRIGTIAGTGGWNVGSAIDFDVTGPDGALVLSRSGEVNPVGSATLLEFDIAPYFGIDIARRIEHFTHGDEDYYIVLDGLGGVHLAGPAGSALRTNWDNHVLTELAYFGAVVGKNLNGGDVYAGLDAANDFVPVLLEDDDIGVIMLDGLGGLHFANLGPVYTTVRTHYLGANPQATLDWMVSLILVE